MSFKAKIMGIFHSTTGFVARLIVAALVAVVIWFISGWAVDYLFNFLASGTYEGIQETKFSSDQPMVMAIRGLVCLVVFVFLARPRKT